MIWDISGEMNRRLTEAIKNISKEKINKFVDGLKNKNVYYDKIAMINIFETKLVEKFDTASVLYDIIIKNNYHNELLWEIELAAHKDEIENINHLVKKDWLNKCKPIIDWKINIGEIIYTAFDDNPVERIFVGLENSVIYMRPSPNERIYGIKSLSNWYKTKHI